MEKNTPKVQPKAKFRVGSVTATVWENKGKSKEGKEFVNQSVKLQRGYKDASGEWANTDSLRTNDIPRAILALNKCFEFLTTSQKETNEEIELD